MTWTVAVFDHTTKTHAMPTELADALIYDLRARHGSELRESSPGLPENPHIATEFAMDLGGPCLVDRPEETFEVAGLKLWIPCNQLHLFAESWRDSEVRAIAATRREYVKLYAHYACLVVLPAQFADLITAMRARMPAAHERNETFLEEWTRKHPPISPGRIGPDLANHINSWRRGN